MRFPPLIRAATISLTVVAALSCTSESSISPPDPQLGALVGPYAFDSLRSSEAIGAAIWLAGDTSTWQTLNDVANGRGIVLQGPATTTSVTCPGSTDATDAPVRDPVGYVVHVETWVADSI